MRYFHTIDEMNILTFQILGMIFAIMICSCSNMKEGSDKNGSGLGGFDLIVKTNKDDPDSANWFVDAFVEDKKDEFYIDTGAATTSMVWDDFTSGLTATSVKVSSGALAKHSDELISVKRIRLVSLIKSNVVVGRASKGSAGRSNLLGMNFLNDFSLHFLFDEMKVVIFDDLQKPKDLRFTDLFLGERSHPYVELKWNSGIVVNKV